MNNNLKKKRVMIIDDDLDFLDEFAVSLYLQGYDVISVTNGSDALKAAKRKLPDIILTDLKMKNVNGFEVANKLSNAELTKNIPIIAITGLFIRNEEEEVIRSCGIRKKMKKPLDPEAVRDEIEKVLKE